MHKNVRHVVFANTIDIYTYTHIYYTSNSGQKTVFSDAIEKTTAKFLCDRKKKKGKFVSNSITNCAVIEIYDGDPKSTVFKHHIWSYLLMVVCVCHGKRAAWLCLVLCLVEVGAHRLHFVLRGSCLT